MCPSLRSLAKQNTCCSIPYILSVSKTNYGRGIPRTSMVSCGCNQILTSYLAQSAIIASIRNLSNNAWLCPVPSQPLPWLLRAWQFLDISRAWPSHVHFSCAPKHSLKTIPGQKRLGLPRNRLSALKDCVLAKFKGNHVARLSEHDFFRASMIS